MRRRPLSSFFFCGVAFVLGTGLSAQEADEPRINVNVDAITIAGRVITQINTSSIETEPDWDVLMRRVRLGADVTMNDLVSGRIHADFSGSRIQLADAYMQLDLAPWAVVRAGRGFRPFGTIEQTTSLRLAPIERGVRIRGLNDLDLSSLLAELGYTDRDIGLQLRGAPEGAPLGMSYALAVMNGPLHGQAGRHNTLEYFARLAGEPMDEVQVGVAWARRDFARQIPGGDFDLKGGNAWVADIEYGPSTPAPGLHLLAEVATGAYGPFLEEDFRGAQAWGSYRFPLDGPVVVVEPLFRVSYADIDRVVATSPQGGTLFTPGVNLYFGGLNRLMLNYDIFDRANGGSVTSFKAQFQLAF